MKKLISKMKSNFQKMDFLLLATSLILIIAGVIFVYSASSVVTVLSQRVESYFYLKRQLIIVLVSFLISFFIIFRMKLYKSNKLIYLYTIVIIASLIGLRFYGNTVNGSQSWYDLGFFNFQPSEFAKTALILFMAVYYEKMIKQKEARWYMYLIPFAVAGTMAFFILLQPDLGGLIIMTFLCLLTFASVPINKYIKRRLSLFIWCGIIIGGLLALILAPKILPEYQLKRFNFWAPCTRYVEDTGYQVCNGFIAIKNGGLTGLGFGNSTQKYLYLPESHTDFIFAIICEEIGLVGGVIIILFYALMLYSILRIAKKASSVSDSIIAYGTFVYLLIHILINLLGILALMPLTGVPLPLLSYGGSFNLNVIVLLFICQRINIDSKNAKLKEKIKRL